MDLHYSQTEYYVKVTDFEFYYLMDLHYSQTQARRIGFWCPFYYLMDLHYSQTGDKLVTLGLGFTTLWIYTILKQLDGRGYRK